MSELVKSLRALTAVLAVVQGAVGRAPAAVDPQAVVEELVTANRILANEGVLDGYGHVSVRHPGMPNHYFLSRSKAPSLVTAADIVEYDLESAAVTDRAAAGYIERFIHGEIYRRRPEVTAIVHCHCPDVIPFAATSVPMRPLYHMAFFVGGGVPVFEIRNSARESDMLIRTPALAAALAATLGSHAAALMRGHGAVVAATSLHLVVGEAYYLNLNARLQLQAIQLGGDKVTYLDPQESARAAQDYERSWDFWKARLPQRR